MLLPTKGGRKRLLLTRRTALHTCRLSQRLQRYRLKPSSFALFYEMISLQLRHRLKIDHLRGVITEVFVCNNPVVILFFYAVTPIREVEESLPTLINLVCVVSQRSERCFQVARLRIYRCRMNNLTICNLVEYLTVDLEHWANLAGDEELKAGDGEHVSYLIVATPRIYLLAIVSILPPILGKQDIINTFKKRFSFFQCSDRPSLNTPTAKHHPD